MADIELVIKIDEKYLKDIKECVNNGDIDYEPWVAIANGIPLPKGHGRLIDADKLKEQDFGDNYYTIKAEIDRADTIVKADRPKILYKDRWYNGLAN